MNTLDLFPVTEEEISFKKFLSLTEEEKEAVESFRLIPPRLGQAGFGKIIVQYKSPMFKHKLWQTTQQSEINR